eukprot:scaffold26887_cov57-Phaeocystis_antarctica.AAC.1
MTGVMHICAARNGETPSRRESASFEAAPSIGRPASLTWRKGDPTGLADLAHEAFAIERAAVFAERLERLAGARACQVVNLLGAEGAHVRQLRQPLQRKLLAAALDVLLEAPRAPEHGGGGAGVLQRLVVSVLVLLVRVVVALDRDLELLQVPQLVGHLVLDGLGVGQRVRAPQRQLHGATLRWRGEALGTLMPLRCEELLLPPLLPVAVIGLVA